jgi:adenine-specific DNA-methyltransferase
MDSLKASDSYQGNEIFLDYFAGSGTTGHAVINLNRKDGRSRKYLLVEMGQYFDTVLMPRIKKVIYSEDWKNGRPISRKGSSHAFKYIQLESFEDTLNNLTLKRSETAQTTLLDETAFGEDYLLHYMMDFESQNSLLNLERFETPFDYQLQIASSTVGETEATPVDLVETFNYLLGLHVQSIRKIEDAVVVRGMTRDEKQVLVIWRTVPEMDNDQLNDFFESHLADESKEITDIYVNGDNNLANIRPDDQHWTVHLTEESFHRLMFEG